MEGFSSEIALKYKVKQSKNGEFPSNYKASPMYFETQISLHRYVPPKIILSKRAFETSKPRGLFSEFYGSFVLSIKKGKEERVDGLTLQDTYG